MDSGEKSNQLMTAFTAEILAASKTAAGSGKLNELLMEIAEGKKDEIEDEIWDEYIPSDAIDPDVDVIITGVEVIGYSDNESPYYKQVSTYDAPRNAVYDITEETIALKMDIPQKRIAAMLVTTVETWSKSATYDNKIVQNSFNCNNYRYVIHHSFFAFGLRVFQI